MLIIDNTIDVNKLVVNTKDVNQSGTNIYLLQFTNNQTKVDYFTLSTDTSTSERYTAFNVSSSVNNPFSSSVYLPNKGQYTYHIYEASNSASLEPLGLNLVDKGKLLVLGSSENIPAYTGSNSLTYYVYTGSQS